MEHAQRELMKFGLHTMIGCLNPYFNGTCSKSNQYKNILTSNIVLILILMEHAQREADVDTISISRVLILILMEHAQREDIR